jgi:hypothetical protein
VCDVLFIVIYGQNETLLIFHIKALRLCCFWPFSSLEEDESFKVERLFNILADRKLSISPIFLGKHKQNELWQK